jgi:hypothetical protein
VFGLGAGFGVGSAFGLGVGLEAGLVAGLGAYFAADLTAVPGDPAGAASPQAVLARDRQAALLLVLEAGLPLGLVFGLVAGLYFGPVGGLVAGLGGGLGIGLVVGLVVSMSQTAWPSYMLTRGWLAMHHRLPWPLMSFLADSHRHEVLRQTGAVYQFRHLELQHRLATRP